MGARNELCLDSNVFVSGLLRDEPHSPLSLQILTRVRKLQIPLFEPALVLSEVSAVFYRKKLEGLLNTSEAKELVALFYQLPVLIQWQESFVEDAFSTALDLSMKRFQDCAYLVVAKCRDIPLVTLDAELLKKGRRIHDKIYSPEGFLKTVS